MQALDELAVTKVIDEVTNSSPVRSTFNPSLAPHIGGGRERSIRNFKRALMAIVKDQHPSEVWHALFFKVDYIFISRPFGNVLYRLTG